MLGENLLVLDNLKCDYARLSFVLIDSQEIHDSHLGVCICIYWSVRLGQLHSGWVYGCYKNPYT